MVVSPLYEPEVVPFWPWVAPVVMESAVAMLALGLAPGVSTLASTPESGSASERLPLQALIVSSAPQILARYIVRLNVIKR